MNEYKYDDLYLGLTESFEYIVTQERMDLFRELSGDVNPLHNDAAFAQSKGFDDKVVYGLLSASLISRLGGVLLPGKYCLIQQVQCKFPSPAYVGDTLSVSGVVEELNDTVRQAVIGVTIKNQFNRKIVKAKLFVGFLGES